MVHGSFDCHLDSALAFRTAAELVVMGDSRFVESYRWELSFFPGYPMGFRRHLRILSHRVPYWPCDRTVGCADFSLLPSFRSSHSMKNSQSDVTSEQGVRGDGDKPPN
jgi:hypothetical protein